MPTVHKTDLLQVVRELWRVPDAPLDDEAKRIVAEALISEAWEHGNKQGFEVNQAGEEVKRALGSRWMNFKQRDAAGLPRFSQVLNDDPYFSVSTEPGRKQAVVKLRISRLSKLIGQPELIAEYRSSADNREGDGSSSSYASGGSSYQQQQQQQTNGSKQVTLTDEGLPIRPGKKTCPHYVKFGWCLFKQDCWFSHPPESKAGGRSAGPDPPVFESETEPGVMLIRGMYPIRPGAKPCTFYIKNGWCLYKERCSLTHPMPSELAAQQPSSTAPSSRASSVVVPMSPSAASTESGHDFWGQQQQQGEAPSVKQPPLQVLLGIVIDAVWPPQSSPAACAKGALAKHIVEYKADEVPHKLRDTDATLTVLGAPLGSFLIDFWGRRQHIYDPSVKPYSGRLADMLEQDPLFRAKRLGSEPPTFTLMLGQLITKGALEARPFLSSIADIVWPPNSGKDAWLRGELAKWLLTAGYEGNQGGVLRQVLAVEPTSPTVFRIDVAQAGEYLRRQWALKPHPYDSSTEPWMSLKRLIADDRFFYIEPAPGNPNAQHVTLDLLDMVKQLPRLARAATYTMDDGRAAGAAASASGGSGGGGGDFGATAASSSSSAAAAAAGPSSSSSGSQQQQPYRAGGGVLEVDVENLVGPDLAPAGSAAGGPTSTTPKEHFAAMLQAAAAAAGGGGGSGGSVSGAAAGGGGGGASSSSSAAAAATGQSSSAGGGGGSSSSRGGAPPNSAESDVAALETLSYMPPPEGVGRRRVQRWWPPNKGVDQQAGWVWTEIAIRLLTPDSDDAGTQVAEMIQHLEISPILAVACSTYAQRPHLLQFFAPYASIGGLEMPACVYLLDIAKPRGEVRNYLSLVAPVLNSRDNIKVCHSSKQWSGMLYNAYGLQLDHYIDTQQTNFVWKSLMKEVSTRAGDISRTMEVSLTALLSSLGFYHPVRHSETKDEHARLLWQSRPLNDELVMAAAADVAYLIPLMEAQVRVVTQAAAAVRQQQSQQRGRAAAALNNLPPELADSSVLDTLAAGVDGPQRGSLSFQKLGAWADLNAFKQEPWHAPH